MKFYYIWPLQPLRKFIYRWSGSKKTRTSIVQNSFITLMKGFAPLQNVDCCILYKIIIIIFLANISRTAKNSGCWLWNSFPVFMNERLLLLTSCSFSLLPVRSLCGSSLGKKHHISFVFVFGGCVSKQWCFLK